jgi:hypothetical protein
VILLGLLVLPGLIQTVRAGNRLSPEFELIQRIGDALSKWGKK